VLLAIGVAALFGVGVWLQGRVHLNHDVAWIVHSAGWMLDGRRLGSDIVDVNPPLIWYFSLPAAALARTGLLSEAESLRLYVWLVSLGALAFSFHMLRPMRDGGRKTEAAAIVLTAAFGIAILSGPSFGQREFFAFVLGLPYCFLIGGRMQNPADASGRTAAAIAGVLAGIGFGFKPWLLAVPAALELLHLARTGNLRAVWRPETVALGATLSAYVLAIVLFTPDYLTVTLPLARAAYWAYEQANIMAVWQPWRHSLTPVVLACVLFALTRSFPPYAWALLCAFSGFSVNYWLQRKGFVYHLYPVTASALLLLVYAGVHTARAIATGSYKARPLIKVMAGFVVFLFALSRLTDWIWTTRAWLHVYDTESGVVGVYRQSLIEKLNRLAPEGSYIYSISTHPFPAFPTMSYTRAEYGCGFVAQFVVPAIAKIWMIQDPAKLSEVKRAAALQREYVVRELEQYRPAVVLVNAALPRLGLGMQPFDDIGFYMTDPRFASLWSEYEEIEQMESIRIFVRRR